MQNYFIKISNINSSSSKYDLYKNKSINSPVTFKGLALNKITQNKLLIKEINSTTYISIKTNDIIISENLILLDYNIDNEHYIYKIEKIGDINEHN